MLKLKLDFFIMIDEQQKLDQIHGNFYTWCAYTVILGWNRLKKEFFNPEVLYHMNME